MFVWLGVRGGGGGLVVVKNNFLLCHIVNFEFTVWVEIQNLQYDNWVLIQNLQYDNCMIKWAGMGINEKKEGMESDTFLDTANSIIIKSCNHHWSHVSFNHDVDI